MEAYTCSVSSSFQTNRDTGYFLAVCLDEEKSGHPMHS